MRVRHFWGTPDATTSFTKPRILISSFSSIAVVFAAAASAGAVQNPDTQVDNSSQSTLPAKAHASASVVDGVPQASANVEPATAPEAQTIESRQAERMSVNTNEQNGNQATHKESYTTNIDGRNVIDIKLDTSSNSSSSASSNSIVNITMNSSSEVNGSQ